MFAKESILSGVFAAFAAVLGKISLSNDSTVIRSVNDACVSFDVGYCLLVGVS